MTRTHWRSTRCCWRPPAYRVLAATSGHAALTQLGTVPIDGVVLTGAARRGWPAALPPAARPGRVRRADCGRQRGPRAERPPRARAPRRTSPNRLWWTYSWTGCTRSSAPRSDRPAPCIVRPTPARSCLSFSHTASTPLQGRMPAAARCHPCQRVEDGHGSPSSQARRAGDAVGCAIRQQGQGGGQSVAASLCMPRLLSGGGCAAAVINQRKRLRRGEYLGGPMGRCQHGQTLMEPVERGRERSSCAC